jgi:exonuclease III
LQNTYKVIAAVGNTTPPEIICLSEIENLSVLQDLLNKTPLKLYEYDILHKDSPDNRGIDVAILFRKDIFVLKEAEFIQVNFLFNPDIKTRDILKGVFSFEEEDFVLYVNHWPSRWGGMVASEPKRMVASKYLRSNIEDLEDASQEIIITGDFNDTYRNNSIAYLLESEIPLAALTIDHEGSHKYKGIWSQLDQIIVSKSMISNDCKLCTSYSNAKTFRANFILESDTKYGGKKLNRTYLGPMYHGGFSDHLPVYVDVFLKK